MNHIRGAWEMDVIEETSAAIAEHGIDASESDDGRVYLWAALAEDGQVVVLTWDGVAFIVLEATVDEYNTDECHAWHEADTDTDTPADLFARVYFKE